MVKLRKDARAPARVGLLLRWLNDDPLSFEDACEAIWQFLEAPGPTPKRRATGDESGHTRMALEPALRQLYGYEGPDGLVPRISPADLNAIKAALQQALKGETSPELRLRVAIRPAAPPRKLSALRRSERRAHLGPGHYAVAVTAASLRDTLLYMLVRLMTAPGITSEENRRSMRLAKRRK
jgi:hypothetical protein